MDQPAPARPRLLPRRARQTILTAHVIMSVGLLGDSAGFLAVAIRAYLTNDAANTTELIGVLKMFSQVFGIPLSIGAIVSGLVLGLGSKWGIFRYPWVTAKLALIVSVMLVGGLVIGPSQAALLAGARDARWPLIMAASYDVIALTVATALSVFKPGRPFRRAESMVAAEAN
jgi:Predicted integral membrane protein (DUF2269)